MLFTLCEVIRPIRPYPGSADSFIRESIDGYRVSQTRRRLSMMPRNSA